MLVLTPIFLRQSISIEISADITQKVPAHSMEAPSQVLQQTLTQILLRRQLETHSGEKPNKCSQCDFSSLQAGDLRRHLKTHSGEKSNKCNQCNYASIEAGILRRHLKTHNGEKPNKCNKCDYASSREDSLKIHLKMHSAEM